MTELEEIPKGQEEESVFATPETAPGPDFKPFGKTRTPATAARAGESK